MAETIVREWIADFKSIRSAEIRSFASSISQNNELIQAVFTVLEEKRYHEEFLEPLCNQFFSFYRSREEDLQNFARQYIPSLIGLYLSSVAKGNRKNVRSVEVVLLGLYNLEVIDSSGKAACLSFRIPLLSKPSIYHEPISLSHTALSERALSNLQYADSRMITVGPFTEVEKINASNRLLVMTVLMWLYNQHIGSMSTFSHMSVCKMCSRFNGLASIGLQTLDELHSRAMQEMLPEVLLVTNAIRNSLKVNPSGQPSDGPMGISVALSPTTVVSTVSRAITNASFRAKKLPDDIPIQKENKDEEGGDSHQLSSINEESEEVESQPPNQRSKKHSSSSSSTFGITKVGVLQLRKAKDKKKEKEPVTGDTIDSSRVNGKHTDVSMMGSNDDIDVRFSNGDQMVLRNSYSCRTDMQLPKSPIENIIPGDGTFDFSGSLSNAKYVNHSNSNAEVVITNDGTCVLKSILHKSESANGLQNSSLQTAV